MIYTAWSGLRKTGSAWQRNNISEIKRHYPGRGATCFIEQNRLTASLRRRCDKPIDSKISETSKQQSLLRVVIKPAIRLLLKYPNQTLFIQNRSEVINFYKQKMSSINIKYDNLAKSTNYQILSHKLLKLLSMEV